MPIAVSVDLNESKQVDDTSFRAALTGRSCSFGRRSGRSPPPYQQRSEKTSLATLLPMSISICIARTTHVDFFSVC